MENAITFNLGYNLGISFARVLDSVVFPEPCGPSIPRKKGFPEDGLMLLAAKNGVKNLIVFS